MNSIHGILGKGGYWVDDSDEIEKVFVNYYRHLFSSSNLSEENINSAIEGSNLR